MLANTEQQQTFIETQHGEYKRLKGQIRGATAAKGAAKITEGAEAVIAVRSVDRAAIVLHRGAASAGPGTGPEAAVGAPPEATVALFAVVESEQAARALMDDARYRAAFTTEDARVRELDVDSYTVYAVASA